MVLAVLLIWFSEERSCVSVVIKVQRGGGCEARERERERERENAGEYDCGSEFLVRIVPLQYPRINFNYPRPTLFRRSHRVCL